jgi:FkbM family methyltransferase
MALPIGEMRFDDFGRRARVARAGRVLAQQARIHLAAGLPPLAILAFDHVGRSVELWGRYESDELALLMWCLGRRVDRQGVVVDAGANIGNHALFFAEHFAEVFAFEPHPRMHAVLSLNATLRPNVRCFALALSDRRCTGVLAVTPGNAGMASLERGFAESRPAGIQVPLLPLDEVPELADRRVALVKIDVEGHEPSVIRGARRILGRDRPVVIFEQLAEEIHDGSSPALDALRSCGYQRFWSVEEFPATGSRLIDALLRRLGRSGLRMVEVDHLERRFHSMIVALPDER